MVTLGPGGALVVERGAAPKATLIPAASAQVVDATGAVQLNLPARSAIAIDAASKR